MNKRTIGLVIIISCFLLMNCGKKTEIITKPILFIAIKDNAGNNIPGVSVRLYKNAADPGIIQLSDTSGYAKFYYLEPELYYWLAEKDCQTNRNSQTTINRRLIAGSVHYGYSVMSETGTLKIINTDTESYKLSDSLFSITVPADTAYIIYPTIGLHTIHSEKLSAPGTGSDTLVNIQCGDTVFINLPY